MLISGIHLLLHWLAIEQRIDFKSPDYISSMLQLRTDSRHFRYTFVVPQLVQPRTHHIKGCGMGPWLVHVSPCFRENVVATCKIGSFLCSFNILLHKNVIVFFFGNQISKWRSFEKRAIFDLLFTFSSHQGKVTKIPSAHISLTYIHVFCSPNWLFLPYQCLKKIRIYQVRFLFGMSPGVDSYSRHFGTINK